MKIMPFLCTLLLSTLSLATTSLQVLNFEENQKASYTSSELNEPVPYWIINGQIVPLRDARKMILEQGVVACATWLMNFSDDKNVSKDSLQESLLQPLKKIPLWKNVSGRPIYVDPETSYALSFICATSDTNGQIIEVDSADFPQIFLGLYSFLEE